MAFPTHFSELVRRRVGEILGGRCLRFGLVLEGVERRVLHVGKLTGNCVILDYPVTKVRVVDAGSLLLFFPFPFSVDFFFIIPASSHCSPLDSLSARNTP